VANGNSLQIVYNGKPLASAQQAFWKVRVWGNDGKPSAWSAPARWEMGLLAPSDWQGKWIGRTTRNGLSAPRRFFAARSA